MHSLNLGNLRVAAVDKGRCDIEIARGGDDLGGGILLGKREDYKNDEGKSLGSLNMNSALGDGRNVAGDTSVLVTSCLLYTSPSPRDQRGSRMPSSA